MEDFTVNYNLPFMTGLAHQKYLVAEEGIIEAAASGCSHWYIDGSLQGEMAPSWDNNRIENLIRIIEDYSCKPIFHGNFKAPLASDVSIFCKAAIEYIKQEIDICSQLKCPLILHGGALIEPKAILKAKKIGMQNFLNSIKELGAYASSKNVELYLENLSNYKHYRPFHYLFTNYEEYEYIFQNIKHLNNVFFFFDVGHSNIGNEDTLQVFKDFHKKIKGISLSNNNGSQDQHLAISSGAFNYTDFIKTMIECNWQGLVAFETRGIDTQQSLSELKHIYSSLH